MHRKGLILLIVVVIGISLYFFFLTDHQVAVASAASRLLEKTPIIPPQSPSNQPGTTGPFDSTIIAAIIGLLGVLLTGLVTFWIASNQNKQSAEDQKQRIEGLQQILHEKEMLDQERQDRLIRTENALKRLQHAVSEKRSDISILEQLRINALNQPDIDKRAEMYRQSLLHDPHLFQIQILDMPKPLDMMRFYVPTRLHRKNRTYRLNETLLEAERTRDADRIIHEEITFLEPRARSTIKAADALRIYKRCVFVGDPGAGKTTVLKYLALKSAAKDLDELPDLPIFIELNAFAKSGFQDLLDFAADKWDTHYGFEKRDARGYIHNALLQGSALLLLDALDEAVIGNTVGEAEDTYHRVTEAIQQVTTLYKQAPIAVTARKIGYRQHEALISFTEFELQGFHTEEIKEFVTLWFNYSGDLEQQAHAADLNARLERVPHVQILATNPLLLSLIVRLYEQQLDLPERRADLYKRCVELLISGWDTQRHIRRYHDLEQRHIRQLLEEIAWHFHQQGQRYFSEDELLEVIAQFLPTVQLPASYNGSVLMAITSEYGLLKEQAQGLYGFFHLTFQEYFVVQHMSNNYELKQLLMHRGDPWWEEICFLYAGNTADASPFLQALLGQDDTLSLQEDIFHTNLILAGGCLAVGPRVRQISLRKNIITQLEQALLQTPYTLIRNRIAQTLVAIGEDDINKRMLDLLTNQHIDSEQHMSIAQALNMQRTPAVTRRLQELFNNPKTESRMRGTIIQSMALLGERSQIDDLFTILHAPQQDWLVSEGIVQSLGILGGSDIVRKLLQLLHNQKIDWYIRGRIIQVLVVMGERSVAPRLLSLLIEQQQNSIYLTSERSVLSNIAQALATLGDSTMVGDLLNLLQSEHIDPIVGSQIAQTLGSLGDLTIVPQLREILQTSQKDIYLRSGIIYALGLLGEPLQLNDVLGFLLEHLTDTYVASPLIQTLGVLHDAMVVPELLNILHDTRVSVHIQSQIVGVLSQFRERQTLPDLFYLLTEKRTDKLVRSRIAQSLGNYSDDLTLEEIEKLVDLLETSDIVSDIHHALWIISRRKGIRIFVTDGQVQKRVRIVKW